MIRLYPDNPFIIENEHEGHKTYYYWCEGCQRHDCFDDGWTVVQWNPLTISPSVRMFKGGVGSGKPEKTICHAFIKNGIIEYLPDCAHGLAGKKVPMTAPKTERFQGL